MAWLKVDDRVRTHPKIAKAGPLAAWMWLCSLCYCREHLTDGFVPAEAVPTLAVGMPQPARQARRLVEVGLWHEVDGGYRVHDWGDWNPSREAVMALRDKERDKKRRQRACPEDVPEGHRGDTHARARDRAGVRALSLTLGSDGEIGEGSAREGGALPAWRHRADRPAGLLDDEAYHRRNCAPWAYAACQAGICVPRYLWPQWARRQPVERLRAFVARWAGQAAGDAAERFWPRAFEAEFGAFVVGADKASRTVAAASRVKAFMRGGAS